MLDGRAVVYAYDGTLEGLLCCVFESYVRHEVPVDIQCIDEPQATLYPLEEISTHAEHAARVYRSLRTRICEEAEYLVTRCFLSCVPERALLLYRFIALGYRYGAKTVHMLADDTVSAVHKAAQAAAHEAHLFTGFVRFSDYSGALAATISPKNNVLPLLQAHFCARYPEEQFMIYDDTHGMALLYHPYKAEIVPVEHLILPPEEESELRYRKLWQQYYSTVAIQARYNPSCRRTHMPKRFWHNLTELQPEVATSLAAAQTAVLPEKTIAHE